MDDSQKFTDAITNLKPAAGFAYTGDFPMTEEKYATVEWVTGVEADGQTAVTTTVNPHPELTWSAVDAEMTRLQTEYDSKAYARKRQEEYPPLTEFAEAYTEKEFGGDATKMDAYKIKYEKVRSDNPK